MSFKLFLEEISKEQITETEVSKLFQEAVDKNGKITLESDEEIELYCEHIEMVKDRLSFLENNVVDKNGEPFNEFISFGFDSVLKGDYSLNNIQQKYFPHIIAKAEEKAKKMKSEVEEKSKKFKPVIYYFDTNTVKQMRNNNDAAFFSDIMNNKYRDSTARKKGMHSDTEKEIKTILKNIHKPEDIVNIVKKFNSNFVSLLKNKDISEVKVYFTKGFKFLDKKILSPLEAYDSTVKSLKHNAKSALGL